MSGLIGVGVSLRGIHQEAFNYPFLLSGNVTAADVGKAVTLDTTKANTMKLAGDGDPIYGWLETVEVRTVEGIVIGAVATKGGYAFPVKEGETINIGDEIQGAGNGEVKALPVSEDTAANEGDTTIAAASHQKQNFVVEVGDGFVVAVLR